MNLLYIIDLLENERESLEVKNDSIINQIKSLEILIKSIKHDHTKNDCKINEIDYVLDNYVYNKK